MPCLLPGDLADLGIEPTSPVPPALQVYSLPLVPLGSLEKGMATHSSIFARRTPWTEEPGKLQSMRSQTVGHD